PAALVHAPAGVIAAGSATPVVLDGTGSTAPLGHQLSFLWAASAQVSFSANDSAAASTTQFLPPAAGQTLTITLVVTDTVTRLTTGLSSQAQRSILVSPPPVARIAPGTLTLHAGTAATVDGSSSSDPLGFPLSYAWSDGGAGAPALSDTAQPQLSFTTGTQ